MIPLFHDFEGKSVVIVGGGRVALRKAGRFAEEAAVTVVAAEFREGFEGIDCERVRRRLGPDDAREVVSGAFLVVPATDDRGLNDAIAAAAREVGCLVNRVDRRGDTVTPALARSARIDVAVSTGGDSPAVAGYLRREIEPLLERADPMVRLQAELRDRLKAEGPGSTEDRRAALQEVLRDDEIWTALGDDRYGDARDRALELVGATE